MKLRLFFALVCGLALGCGEDSPSPCDPGDTQPCEGGRQLCVGGEWGACESDGDAGAGVDEDAGVGDAGLGADAGLGDDAGLGADASLGDDAGGDGSCSGSPTSYTLRITEIPTEDDGNARGMNLDEMLTNPVCGSDDYVDPVDGEMGVDSFSGHAVRLVMQSLPYDPVAHVSGAEVDVAMTLSGVDDWENDPCVSVSLDGGEASTGAISDGVLRVGSLGSLTLPMYLSVGIPVAELQLKVPVEEGRVGPEVVLAGRVQRSDFVRQGQMLPAINRSFAEALAEQADLAVDGECSEMSFTYLGTLTVD